MRSDLTNRWSKVCDFKPLVIGIGGTARPGSTSERVVIRALAEAAKVGAETYLFGGAFLSTLPLYVPDRTERTLEERYFLATVRRCDGVIVCTPGYHGSLSGPIKNVLDLIEDTAADERPYLEGRAFGCVVTAYGWQACGSTLVSLRMIAHALRAWPTSFGAALNASTPLFETDGTCIDSKVDGQIGMVARQVVEFARFRRAGLAMSDCE